MVNCCIFFVLPYNPVGMELLAKVKLVGQEGIQVNLSILLLFLSIYLYKQICSFVGLICHLLFAH